MPYLEINTNVAKASITDLLGLTSTLTSALAASLGKPEKFIMLRIVPDEIMTFGGSDAPALTATLTSIGQLGTEELNQKQAEVIIPVLEKHLGVPKDRMFVSFRNVEREDMAWNGSVFSIIMKK